MALSVAVPDPDAMPTDLPSLSPLTTSRKDQIDLEQQIRTSSRPGTADPSTTPSPSEIGQAISARMRENLREGTEGRVVRDPNADRGWEGKTGVVKVNSPREETKQEKTEREERELDEMRVCGVGLGELLRWQKEDESERSRMVRAADLITHALKVVEPKHLAMISKLKAPPPTLCAVLEMLLILLHEELPDIEPTEPGEPPELESVRVWPTVKPMLEEGTGTALHERLLAYSLEENLDPETMDLLEPYLRKFTHSQVRQTVGVISSIFTWISAVAVLGGSPHARPPSSCRRPTSHGQRAALPAQPAAPSGSRPCFTFQRSHRATARAPGGSAAASQAGRPSRTRTLVPRRLLSESRPGTRSSSPTQRPVSPSSPSQTRPKYKQNADAVAHDPLSSGGSPTLYRSPSISRNPSIQGLDGLLDGGVAMLPPSSPDGRRGSGSRERTPVLRASPSGGAGSPPHAASHARLQRPGVTAKVVAVPRGSPSPQAEGELRRRGQRPPPLGRSLSGRVASPLGARSPLSGAPRPDSAAAASPARVGASAARVSPIAAHAAAGGAGQPGGGLSVSGPSSLLGAADEPAALPGSSIRSVDDVQPLKFLGAGSFANVFMCRDRHTGQVFAMKSVLKALALKQNKHRQVIAEKDAICACHHHCIIGYRASFADAQHLYLLMELALGGELFALMDDRGRFDETQTCFYASSVVLAFQHLHAMGFIYRDLKPENLLLDARGYLKVADLGLAKKAQRAWTLVGTPEYVAPEVLRGEGASQAVDWWQLGILVFEMLAACLPFESDDDTNLFVAIRKGFFEWPTSHDEKNRQKVPMPSEVVKDLVAKLLRQALPGDDDFEASPDAAHAPAGEPRLGAGGRDAHEVMEHPWFAGVDWEALAVGAVPVPFVPQLQSDDDDSNFGPMEWRGKPIVGSFEYDVDAWRAFFANW